MHKKILSLLLALLLLTGMVLPVSAEESGEEVRRITIVNWKNFEKLVENCRLDSYSQNLVVSLETDLDLEGRDFAGIPIFCGLFEGNGHTIRGLDLTKEGSAQGFFRYLTDTAVVQNLHLEGSVQPSGSAAEVGGFAGKNSGVIRNCSFSGTVAGKEFVGGIVGYNTVSATVEYCNVSGTISGSHFTGGIAGKNAGVIHTCENTSRINETPQENTVALTDITLQSAIQSESAATVTDVGGIAGISTGLIRSCRNLADIGHSSMGYNVGGIAGTQSGTIFDCENLGNIYGRKEVGGIVGQMEPSVVMEFEMDMLQILEQQLQGMGRIVDDAAYNVKDAGESIAVQMSYMQYHVMDALEAVETLVPESGDFERPSDDTLMAARNNIGSSILGMSQIMEGVGATAFSAMGAVSTNLQALNNQINAMRTTIGNASETLGGSITDLSDEDTEDNFSGKVADCKNVGAVQADLNGGGITGAIAMENDLDMEEDWFITGENSLNFESEVRAVILNCENDAQITVGKQNAGGIVGFQSLGLVKNSRNFGRLDASSADYVGGISGRSQGYIRNSHANGEILGTDYVGGIAGSAMIATDCYALVRIPESTEKVGSLLGYTEENQTEDEQPIARNYYLPIGTDLGAIDGISYDGQAQPMREDGFFLLEGLPERFSQVVVTFRYSNGTQRKFVTEFGSAFPEEWIPPIPPKDGRQAYWKGMEESNLSGVFFDMFFDQEYTTQTTVLESSLTRAEIPLLLVQGSFAEDAVLTVEPLAETAVPEIGEAILETWSFRTTEPERQTQIRLQLPEHADPEKLQLFLLSADDTWREAEHHVFGRYAVAPLQAGDSAIALVQLDSVSWWLIIPAIAAVLVLAGIPYLRKKKNKT